MKKLLLVSLCFLMLLVTQVFAQSRTVTGTVTGKDDGLPIPGVTIRVKGTKAGTQTNSSGTYSITAPENSVLEFSFIGYNTASIPASSGIVNVSLESNAKQLNEVVVTSLGIRREKRALGYSIQDVKGDDLTKAGETDALKALSGKVAGVQVTTGSGSPGGGVYIQIRGAVSITGNNQPLFVIDGVPIDNSSNATLVGNGTQSTQTNRAVDINPDDIESMSVLKGPSAAALYGIQAAAGAIVITTKKGKAGKAQVDVSTGVSFNRENRLPKLQNQFIKGLGSVLDANSTYESTNRYSWGANVDSLYYNGVPNGFSKQGEIVGKSDPTAKTKFVPFDNVGTFFRTGAQYDNSVAITGGNDNGTYRTSVTNSYQNSIIPLQYFQRTTVSFSGALNISKRLKATTSVSYTGSNGSEPQEGSNTSGIMLDLLRTPISFDNSNGLKNPENNSASYLLPDGVTERNFRGGVSYDNPYFTINKDPYTTNVGRIIGSIQLDYNIGSGFSALYRFGGDNYQDNRQQFYEIGTAAVSTGEIIQDRYTYHSLNSDLILNYTKKLGNDFQFDGKIGNNFTGHKTDELQVTGSGLAAPDFQNIANASTVTGYSTQVPVRSYSFYYDLNLSYKNFLYLETTGRNDHVSTLPSNKNSFFYPSANLSFVFSELGDLKNSSFLSLGKLRASFTQVGNVPPAFSTSSGYASAAFGDGFTTGIVFPLGGVSGFGLNSTEGNPALKPEISTAYEIGTQLQFFGNRLGLDATFYHDRSTNEIVSVSIPGSTGYLSTVLNSGTIQNKGFELQLSGTEVKSENFTWSSFVNFSLNRNKVVQLAPGLNEIDFAGFTGATQSYITGQPFNVIYGYGFTKSNGQTVIDDSQGNKGYYLSNTNKPEVIGNPNPKFLMGFGNTFRYKALSLYALVDWRFKGDIWDGTRGALVAYGRAAETANRGSSTTFNGVYGHINSAGQLVHYAADGVTELPGAGAKNTTSVVLDQDWYQGDGGGFGTINQEFVEDGSFIKLREITLSYDFKSLLAKNSTSFIKGLSAGIFARNIIIWTPYKGVDPETSLNSGGVGGEDYFNNPGAANYGFNVKVKF